MPTAPVTVRLPLEIIEGVDLIVKRAHSSGSPGASAVTRSSVVSDLLKHAISEDTKALEDSQDG